jgi:two-component SAPR family response regulator
MSGFRDLYDAKRRYELGVSRRQVTLEEWERQMAQIKQITEALQRGQYERIIKQVIKDATS